MIPEIHILDLGFLQENSVIASFLIDSGEGLVLIETGPETTFEHLKSAIAAKGYDWKDVGHVLLTHIHFDHAGAAWKFADNGAMVYVHPVGLPHLNHPDKLWNSAKMIYGSDMERLWGSMEPIDKNLLTPVGDGDVVKAGNLEFKVHYTPGHAVHHNAYQLGNSIFTGDVGGVKIAGGPVVPPCPPPDINVEQWQQSINTLRQQRPDTLYLTHYGSVHNPAEHLEALEKELLHVARWMKPYHDAGTPPAEVTPLFEEYTRKKLRQAGVSEENILRYEGANPAFMSVTGLLRYWKLKEQGRI